MADDTPTGNTRIIRPDFGPREAVSYTKAATPQQKYSGGGGGSIYQELGRTGLRHWGGFVFEEWLRELQQGRKAAEVFREMMDSDAVVGGMMYAIEMLCRRVNWWVEPASSSALDKKNAEWMDSVLHDMSYSWEDTVAEILSFLGYGWAYFEEVFKVRSGDNRDPAKRSKHNDGTIGIRKLSIRSQDSLWKWVFDEEGGIDGMIQNPPPDYQLRYIPIEKALLFRTRITKGNPEGRALAADTPIPTPSGWKRMDELAVGDTVYDEGGQSIPVIGVAAWDDRPCYEVKFNGGYSIIADANHLWSVNRSHDRKKPQLLTTQAMAEKLAVRTYQGYSAGRATAIEGTSQDLPVDPYVLGYWLGDGNSRDGRIACGIPEDAENLRAELESVGFTVNACNDGTYYSIPKLKVALREAGVLENKHIPEAYLLAPIADRLALLQGLMDSDGSVLKGGCIAFFNSNERLIADFVRLARSLGAIPRKRVGSKLDKDSGFLNGRRVVHRHINWCVSFTFDQHAFRLPRKIAKQRPNRSTRTHGHNIVSITPVENQRTVCIQVDKPLGLFLAGEALVPTHNSVLRSAYKSWYFAKNLAGVEAIGIERDLAGLPILITPEGVDIWDTNDPAMVQLAQQAKNVVSSIRRDEQEGVLLPFGWDLKLLSTGGRRQMDVGDTIIRYEQRIATSVLLDVILMGQDKVGSYALADVKKGLFTASLGAYLDQTASVWNMHAIPQLFQLNGFNTDAGYPKICHGSVETVDLDTLGNYVQKLAGAGAPLFGNELEDPLLEYLLDQASLPMPGNGATPEGAKPPTSRYNPRGSGGASRMGNSSVEGAKAKETDSGQSGDGG